MIDRGTPPKEAWPSGVLDGLRAWEQGDLLAAPPLFYFADPFRPIWHATTQYTADADGPEIIVVDEAMAPPFGMVTTQTCDIAEEDSNRPVRPWVQIAPVYELTNWKRARFERVRTAGYWIYVPEIGGKHPYVADLRIEVPVEKAWLVQQERIVGFKTEAEKRQIGTRLADVRARPAFSRDLGALHRSIDELLGAGADDDNDLVDRLAMGVHEVGLRLDSHSAPTSVQVVFLTGEALDADCLQHLADWRAGMAAQLADSGIALHPHEVQALDALSAAEYRKLAIVWRR